MPYPVPNYWIVSGTFNKNGIPFYEGKVYADNLKNGVFQTIAETGISSDGSFTLGFSSSQFQNGDTTLEYPTLRIRVEDYQQNTLWTSGIYNEPDSALNIGAVDILNYQGGDCRVFGTVKNNQGNVLSGLKINAYCLHFEETVSSNSTTRRFRKIVLGTVDTDLDGRYEIRYSSSMLPTGLHLDSKEDYGKDKVSLYAEVFEQGDNETYKSLAIEHLVFNGKSEQEINFTLKSQQKVFRCEFEKIEQSLAVYYDAVFAEYDGSDITKKISAIGKFLKSNTTFPLVTGRERIADSKAQAYFMAYSLFLQLQKRLTNDPKADEFLSPDPPKKWPEVFFALALREGVSTLVRLKSIKPTVIQKTLFGAVSDGLICPVDTTYILELWKKLVNGNMLQGEDGETDDSLTISQLISLYIKGNLTIEFPSEGQSQDGEEAAGRRPHYVAVEDFAEETANEGTGTDNGSSLDGDGQEEDGQEEIQEPPKSDDQVLYEELLEAYYNVGADTGALIEWLQEAETPHLTQAEISRLKAVFDLNDFFEKFAPGVVCAYRYAIQKENFEFGRLADLIYLDDSDWKSIVDEIAEEYYTLYRYEGTVPTNGDGQLSSALPPEFPGSNVNLKKIVYARKLSEQIIAWFPQQALLWGLKDRLEDQEWGDTCDLLMSPAWEDFSLSDTDLDEYIGDSTVSAKEKIQQLQRLYHLTESAEAIAYLINHGFKSAYQISTMSENEFVAKHGNGIGKVAEARQIHRLAQNYMAEASLNIQAYVTSSVEEPAEEPEEEIDEEQEEGSFPQNLQEPQNVTLRAIPRALPKTRMLKATDPELNTNTARIREATRDTINWAGLFGNINFTKATQGQSILSASAYYIDLLKFLKKSTAYNAFKTRRPDYLDLQLTKANAEIPMPTIDLGIELLECLVNDGLDKNGKACVVANNNPVDATAAVLRAEPLEFKDGEDKSIDDAAALLLARKIYPFQLPANFSRDKARKILSNLSLHFYDIPKLQHANAESTSDCRELRLDFNQRCLMDSSLDCGQFSTWDMWGLKEHGNEIILPDKNSTTTGNYIGVLRRVAVFLQRTGFTIHDLNEILNNGNFDGVRYRPKDSEFYQLANINGYEFVPRMVVVNEEEVPVNVDWDSFFRKMAVLVHRKNILDWSLSDILLTFNLSLEELDVVCELVGRYNVSVQDAMVLGCKQEETEEFINSVYQLPGLLVSVNGNDEGYRRTALKLLVEGLGLSEEDSENIYDTISVGDDDSLLQVLYECYRYSLIAKSFGISVPNLGRIVEYGAWTDDHTLESIRELSDEWRILSGTSVDVDFYLDLLAPISEDEKAAANDFALNLVASSLGDKPTPGSQNYGPNATFNTYEDALDAWHDNLKLLICAEFGLVKGQGEELLPDDWPPEMDGWEDFYADAKQYDEIVHSKGGTRTGIVETPRLPTESYELYVTLLRKVAVYNFIQKTQQGIDLTTVDFLNAAESDSGKYGVIRPLIVANYVTDRLLSGDFDIDRLVEGEDLENLLAVGSDVIGALKGASFEDPADCTSLDGWLKFTRYYELYAKTHLLPTDLDGLLAEIDLVPGSDNYDENIGVALSSYTASVKTLEDAVRANTRESEWLKFAQEMNDDLRRRKRDALAAYVCWDSCILPNKDYEKNSRYPRKFVDENDIYGYYLMDVKMEPDMTISRIVQASASIQLFVQRAELGLEGENILTDEQRSEWEWMKNYRVWEAARKVFLYPENWIASDLRDDKTPFFEELEERIQEFSDDHKNLEDALFEYLEKVREVSSIEIVGATKEDGGDEGGILYTLHIIGRTRGEPHAYYYRKYKAKATLSGEWTPWERLDVDIPSETVVPAVVNQRLYLLWPQVTMGQRSMDAASDGGMENIEYYARIRICWTSYTGTKWTGTRMTCNALYDTSSNQLDFALGDNEAIDDRYSLKTESSLDWVKVSIVKTAYKYQEYEEIVGTTEVMDGSTKINKVTKRVYDKSRQFYRCLASIIIKNDGSDTIEFLDSDYLPIDDYAPERTQLVHGVFTEIPEFTCGNKGLLYPEDNAVLNYTPGLFRIVATNLSMLKLDRNDKVEDLPFFYMDDRRTFFVQAVPKDGDVNSGQKNYRFELLSHSLVDDFYKRYRDGGTKWLYTRETQALPISDSYYYSYSYYNYYFSVYLGYYMAGDWQAWDLGQTIFRYNYWPNKANVDGPYPAPMVDFVWGGANAMYNWELFFYVPMLIAEKMIAEQSYEEALLWLQLVFDPRENYSAYERTKHFIHLLPKGARYWKFLPFFANKDADKSILQMLGMPTKRDKLPDRTALSSLADKWKNDPFNPHLIARYRNVAYQKYVVMKYLDTLIGWGDREFAKDTTESVNLAIQFYVLAAELLGPKNPEAPEPDAASPLKAKELLSRTDDLGNAFIEYENAALVGKGRATALLTRSMDARTRRTGNIVESMFYFSIPRNETLFSYWDTIADRLYKIRNSLNIQGVKRALALFAPPIDPGLMVKAQAMGLSVDSILNSADAKLPIYRFRVIVKLAVDMAKDACQMGRDLLGILEKQDAEQLQVFKAKCDKAVVAETRAVHEMKVKSLEVEKTKIEEKKATKQNVTKQQKVMHLVSKGEEMYQKAMEKVARIQEIVEKVRNIASATYKMPDFKYGSVINAFGGPRFDIESLGGTKLAENLISAAESYAARFAQRQLDAAKTKLQAELERRKKEWLVEDEVADAEVAEIEKEEVVNEIKVQQVEKEQKNIEREILRSEEIYDVLSEKFTNNDLYIWLEKELGKVFRQYVKTLLEVAQMAEKAYHFEIEGDSTKPSEFMVGDYWETFYKGLLAPERILLDLRRMEKAYLENDVHEMEITRPISLKELQKKADDYEINDTLYANPLNKIREDGACNFQLTEKFFENEFSNLSFLRIKDVQIHVKLTENASLNYLNAKLTLTAASIYGYSGVSSDSLSASMVASLVHQEPNNCTTPFSSEKLGVFEGYGTVSKWTLVLNGLKREREADDYPIDDVIVYLTYKAREGGENA
ncbi:Tc toxin subunit A-related protein [Fibrobacter sp.]